MGPAVPEGIEEAARILVAQHADDQGQRTRCPGLALGQGLGQGAGGVGVMSPVQPQLGIGGARHLAIGAGSQPLHACGPADGGQTLDDGRLRQVQFQRDSHGQPRIIDLVGTDQCRQRQVQKTFLILIGHAAALGEGVEVGAHDGERAVYRLGGHRDGVHRLFGLATDQASRAGLENARLFYRDAAQGGAQELGMVQIDGRDDTQQRARDDVGGVQHPP